MIKVFDLRARVWTRTAFVIAILCVLAIGMLYQQPLEVDRWRDCSSAFVEQVNALGRSLEPGGTGVIHVTAEDADELILLPGYSTREDLERGLTGLRPAVIDILHDVSCDDSSAPALVWLRGGCVLSINLAKFSVGLSFTPRSWMLQGYREILVAKEARSRNSFLSLTFR